MTPCTFSPTSTTETGCYVYFYGFIHDSFQHAGAAPIATTIILRPIIITINIMYHLGPMDMTLSMIPHIFVLRSKTSVYTFSTLLIPFDWDQPPVSSVHYCLVQDQSSPFIIQLRFLFSTVYSSRRARSYHFLEHSTCILSLTVSFPTVPSFPPRCHAWPRKFHFVWGSYYRIGLPVVSVPYISLMRRGL